MSRGFSVLLAPLRAGQGPTECLRCDDSERVHVFRKINETTAERDLLQDERGLSGTAWEHHDLREVTGVLGPGSDDEKHSRARMRRGLGGGTRHKRKSL